MPTTPVFHPVDIDGLKPGEVRQETIGGKDVAIFNIGGAFFATSDFCTHLRGRMSDGHVEGETVTCPLHFGKFNIRTGQAMNPPCKAGLPVYPVRLEGGTLMVGLPAQAEGRAHIPVTPASSMPRASV